VQKLQEEVTFKIVGLDSQNCSYGRGKRKLAFFHFVKMSVLSRTDRHSTNNLTDSGPPFNSKKTSAFNSSTAFGRETSFGATTGPPH
jgi:hypothetical protein